MKRKAQQARKLLVDRDYPYLHFLPLPPAVQTSRVESLFLKMSQIAHRGCSISSPLTEGQLQPMVGLTTHSLSVAEIHQSCRASGRKDSFST
jgi:hypothetical protein